jgi:autotransporter adhesin
MGQISGLASGFQSQISGLQSQIFDNRTEARRGVAAAVATASAPMPSAPGKTTWQVRASTFQSEYGLGFGFAHRLNTSMPLSIVGGYGNGGGNEHTAYVGLGGEF